MSGAGSSSSTTCSCPRCGRSGRRGATGSSAGWAGWRWRSSPGAGRGSARPCAAPATALDADWPIATIWPALAANTARFLARDYPLDRQSDEAVLARFDVRGYERLRAAMDRGRGAILVGSHLGAHIAGVHWLYRRGVPLAAAGAAAPARLARAEPPVRRRRPASAGRAVPPPRPVAGRGRRADPPRRAALRDGLAIYMNGDIPWSGPNTCPGRLLGRPHRMLAIWTELAVLTQAPVFLVFCTHAPAGRFALEIEPLGWLRPGEEAVAVADYLRQLESADRQFPGRRRGPPGLALLRAAPPRPRRPAGPPAPAAARSSPRRLNDRPRRTAPATPDPRSDRTGIAGRTFEMKIEYYQIIN